MERKRFVFLGLSLSSSWGNGHATNFRALLRALARRGHEVVFLERDVPWYAVQRDLCNPEYAELRLYSSVQELGEQHANVVRSADCVVIGSYVPDGRNVAEWALGTAAGPVLFYDIDTPVTLERLDQRDCPYLTPELVPRFDAVLSFAGGRALEILRTQYGAQRAEAFYCLVDSERYCPSSDTPTAWEMGYLGTYAADRQAGLEELLLRPARALPDRKFVVAGPQFPAQVRWPENVQRIEHVPPEQHAPFYQQQRFTLNLTRRAMRALGHAPSVRLFEAAACGVPIISDWWTGLDAFFEPGTEILIAESSQEVVDLLQSVTEEQRRSIARAARERVLASHTAEHRAVQLEQLLSEIESGAKPKTGALT